MKKLNLIEHEKKSLRIKLNDSFTLYNNLKYEIWTWEESLVLELSNSHALISSFKYENAMLFEANKSLEYELHDSKKHLNKFSCDTLHKLFKNKKHAHYKSDLGFVNEWFFVFFSFDVKTCSKNNVIYIHNSVIMRKRKLLFLKPK